ncbi:hypothetical protein [Endozoicomonas sp.]|uniref:hypothetical protein n=1 Tax=Endozoicomonas sp. TaxID=1892382 RepID=UPI00383A2E86
MLFYKAYLYSSVTGMAGTIIADILAHINTSSSVLFAKVCPMTIGLLTALSSLSSIISEIIKKTEKPATNPDHFLMRDDLPDII